MKNNKIIKLNESQLRNIIKESINELLAYHGTKYNFDQFSTDFSGKGEGANAQGYGVYVTLDKDNVATHYAKYERSFEERHSTIIVNGQPMLGNIQGGYANFFRDDFANAPSGKYNTYNNIHITQQQQEKLYTFIETYFSQTKQQITNKANLINFLKQEINKVNIVIDKCKEHLKNIDMTWEQCNEYLQKNLFDITKEQLNISFNYQNDIYPSYFLNDVNEIINLLNDKFPNNNTTFELPNNKYYTGIIYTLNIPDDNGNNYLDFYNDPVQKLNWKDTYITQFIQKINNEEYDTSYERIGFDNPFTNKYAIGKFYWYLADNVFGQINDNDTENYKGTKKTSQYLYKHNITGFKYDSKYNNLNYVLFNPNDVKIINKEFV